MNPLPVINQQPSENLFYHPEGMLEVVDVWHTIQGEGPFVGYPAIFVRLAGCNLRCNFCDTNYTTNRTSLWAEELFETVKRFHSHNGTRKLIVITGGEPFRQNLTPFVKLLINSFYRVQIETNGTLAPSADKGFPYSDVSIVCSPKAESVAPRLGPHIAAMKYVMEADCVDPDDGLPTISLGGRRPARVTEAMRRVGTAVYVQPLDIGDPERMAANRKACVESCLKFGYRLSLQTHKILGLK